MNIAGGSSQGRKFQKCLETSAWGLVKVYSCQLPTKTIPGSHVLAVFAGVDAALQSTWWLYQESLVV